MMSGFSCIVGLIVKLSTGPKGPTDENTEITSGGSTIFDLPIDIVPVAGVSAGVAPGA